MNNEELRGRLKPHSVWRLKGTKSSMFVVTDIEEDTWLPNKPDWANWTKGAVRYRKYEYAEPHKERFLITIDDFLERFVEA